MHFFEKYFTRHHLLRSPHRWFLAFLSSPLHFAGVHYKRRYHIKYIHAKKLFIFDISLLLSIFVLIFGTIFWFAYDPTITDLVYFNITPDQDRIESGQNASYTINYKNNSDISLINPKIALQLPSGFVFIKASPSDLFNNNINTFELTDLSAGANGELNFEGLFYGDVNSEYHINSIFSYRQEARNAREEKIATVIAKLPGSVLDIEFEGLPKSIISQGSVPIRISMNNTGKQVLNNIYLPLGSDSSELYIKLQPSKNIIVQNDILFLDSIDSGESITLEAILVSNIAERKESVSLALRPTIKIGGETFLQYDRDILFNVLYPHLYIENIWKDNVTSLSPGEAANLLLSITNDGTVDLVNVKIITPIPQSIIDVNKLKDQGGVYNDGQFILDKNSQDQLQNIKVGETKIVSITIPIRDIPSGGNNIKLSLTPKIEAGIPDIINSKYTASNESSELKIGGQMIFTGETRYYTDEGDQLGRGSLPPKVGKETKYWALLNISNTTSKFEKIELSAQLPNYVSWTGKTSVSHGRDVSYNESSHKISWSLPSLSSYEKAGVYVELSITPEETQRGTTPLILQNISISGRDSYIGKELNKRINNLDISLISDEIGRTKGFIVQ